ncbi:MAG TPA: Hsp20/alpha crystallin family protein [Planctomycetota bacterium]|nr:Hsp20/alpha crystallin family protein [Planctomycetota bacterium]
MFAFNRLAPLLELSEADELIDDVFLGANGAVHVFPAVNVWKNAEAIIVTAELPGYRGEDLEVLITGKLLTIKGGRGCDEAAADARPCRIEREIVSFERSIPLPFRAEQKDIEAVLRNGVLWIKVPVVADDKPRKITVK